MYWRCDWCGAVNKVARSSAESLLNPGTFKALCPNCGVTSKKAEQVLAPPLSLLDVVETALAKEPSATHKISEGNSVEVIDTPRLWGTPFDKVETSGKLGDAAGDLVARMGSIIEGGRSVIDIVSLDAPGEDDEFERMIFRALRSAIKLTEGEVVIRILFGFVPVEGRFNVWSKRLLKYIKGNVMGCKVPRLYLGQLYSAVYKQWNHAKIIAADGCQAIAGGHNLWWASYSGHPPAHDISLHVRGQAAYDTQAFCEYMWNWGGWWLDAYMLKPGDECKDTEWVKVETTASKQPVRLFCCFPSDEEQTLSTSSKLVFPPAVLVENHVKPYTLGSRELLDTVERRGYSARIMGLARCGQTHLPSKASDLAKETVIKNARRSLKLCQQDLVFSKFFKDEEHLVCRWIAEALLANGELRVQIVVSPQRAWAGGAPYSWGDGAVGAMTLIQKFLKKLAPSNERYEFALQSLQIAPFCFTECEFKSEADYAWPGLGKICTPFPIGSKVLPTPANHCKFYIGDDSVCYVGSDNVYPNKNGEFGYLVEGEAVTALVRGFWDQVWTFSSPHCVVPKLD